MTVKATENCVESLMVKGIKAVDIVVQNPTVTLDTVDWQDLRIKIDCTRSLDISSQAQRTGLKVFWNAWM